MAIDTDKNRINDILERGVEEIVDKAHLEKQLKSGKKLRIKLGIDPTGPMMHIGRASILWKLKAFQDLGHQVILIIGDFTSLIGDASDKTETRKRLTKKDIKENMKGYAKQLGVVLDMKKVELRHNSEWLKKMSLQEMLEMAMNFTAQQMIQRRNFKERWDGGKPIGLHELFYPLLQGTDSVAIKADVELGGFDQLFNLKAGRDLQRINGQKPQDIMALKMLDGLDGRKMSTSWGNVINILDEPNDMFGKLMSMKDDMMPSYFEICTKLAPSEVTKILKQNPRDAKARLSKEVVALYHGEKKAKEAEEEFNRVFKEKALPSNIPIFTVSKKDYPIMDLLKNAGLVASKGEARRTIEGGGVRINNEKKIDWQENIFLKSGDIISVGKRKFIKIKVK